MNTSCINLREQFGKRYRVEYEESYFAEYGDGARVEDPAYMVIPCRYGHLYPAGGDLLAASVGGHPRVARRLRALPCCRVDQDGDGGELTVIFHVEDFAKVARVMRAKTRRRLSPEHQARLIAAGEASRFGHGNGSNAAHTARPGDPRPSGDSEPVKRQRALFGP